MRRSGPRPLARAVHAFGETLAPSTTLARVQGCWAQVAGPAVAAEAEPAGERDGVVTVRCRSSVWAHELQLLAGDLEGRLNDALKTGDSPHPIRGLRFVTARPPGDR
jgi:predicted nucleic acid-binding Zn ribbon protein